LLDSLLQEIILPDRRRYYSSSARVAGQRDHINYHQVGLDELDPGGEANTTQESMADTYTRMDENLSIHNTKIFRIFFLVTQVPGVIAMIMMLNWTYSYRGGFAWGAEDPGHAFNWHPLLMVIGMVFLYGNGALVYRVLPPVDQSMKTKLKITHAIVMGIVFILMVVALQAAFDSHNLKNPPIPNMYTLHSWIGLTAALLFGVQWFSGLAVFLFPVAGAQMRANLLPFHTFYGAAIFVLACTASLMGLLEKAIWAIKDYNTKSGEGLVVNVMGLMIVLFAMGVLFMLSKFEKKKHP